MKYTFPEIFTLENFEGPLDFLLHLIYQNEIDIYEVSLQKIIEQYLAKEVQNQKNFDVNSAAEFIGLTSLLLFLKSRMLLPKHEQPLQTEEESDPHFEIIHQLIEYCRFKEAAKELLLREEQQSVFFARGVEKRGVESGVESPYSVKKNLGVEHLSLQDLAHLFKQIANRADQKKEKIHEEEWLVSDKIQWIQESLHQLNELKFTDLFNENISRAELVVTFLAILELMKLGKVHVIKEMGDIYIKTRLDDNRN